MAKKLTTYPWSSTVKEHQDKINELIDEINDLKAQLLRIKKDKISPVKQSPYSPRKRK